MVIAYSSCILHCESCALNHIEQEWQYTYLFKDYGKDKIFCPTIEQQSEIAKGLSNINDKIEVEKQILLCLQKQKILFTLTVLL